MTKNRQMVGKVDDLAIFGGRPIFDEPKSIGQLAVPEFDTFMQILERVDTCSAVVQLERRLAEFHGVAHCVAMANAGFAIMLLIKFFAADRRGNVVMPALTFRGLPHFARWAGQSVRFCDVDLDSHGLDPARVADTLDSETTSILAVCNAHDAGDIDGLCAVADQAGVPIFFDSVYAFGNSHRGLMMGGFGAAEVYSLHATKVLNGFEGGYVTTNEPALAAWLRRAISDPDLSDGLAIGLNELHAAMALSGLADLNDMFARNAEKARLYQEGCRGLPGFNILPRRNPASERYNWLLMVGKVDGLWPLSRDATVRVLRAEGAAINSYYSPPLHRSIHCPPGCGGVDLPVTQDLAERCLQLPAGDATSPDEIVRLCERLHMISDLGPQIAEGLAKLDGSR
ncbi:MAG: aminotransferase class I/II-fold pyridoxal phosphate-dependent enzyme [Ferrovibrionaceae bacterium]